MIKSKLINKKNILATVIYFTVAFSVYSQVKFDNLDLNSSNKVVFTVEHNISGVPKYKSAFMADVSTMTSKKVLTCYPEKMELLSNGAVLQIRNRYGVARYSKSDSSLDWLSKTDTIPYDKNIQANQSVSPDGKWICYIKRTDSAFGELILKNASTLQETVLDLKANYSFESVPVLWNPDSTTFIYEKDNQLFFCEPKAAFQKVQLTEEFRKIGNGSINCVKWANQKTLIYINRDIVYRISANELYTRSLYSSMVGVGIVSGRLPSTFNIKKDKFYVNSTVDKIIVVNNNKTVTVFDFFTSDFNYLPIKNTYSLSNLGGSVLDTEIYWNESNNPLLWTKIFGLNNGIEQSIIFDLNNELRKIIEFNSESKPLMSPDLKKICFSNNENLDVYNLNDWSLRARLSGEKIVSYLWGDNNTIYVGGISTVREWKIPENKNNESYVRTLFLSSVKNIFWKTPTNICAEDFSRKNTFYDYDFAKNIWQKTAVLAENEVFNIPTPTVQNGKYRVYTGNTSNENFENTLYVRTLSGKAVTNPLFPKTSTKDVNKKKVSIIIDVIDDDSGLAQILSVLKKFDIKATFFVNGEFIRRYPNETKQITLSGFECGSMFFANAPLITKDFVVNEEFIRRGLARNEDEFFQVTEKELLLLWHAPYYQANDAIKKAGIACGYKYIEAGRFNLDSITLEDTAKGKAGYLSASEMITFYIENSTEGSVIPVCAGVSKGTRSDYLYEKLDLLITSLLNENYKIVPIEEL